MGDGVHTVLVRARPDDPGDEARVLADVEAALFGKTPAAPRVGRYEIRDALGSGAFGAVYVGHDPELDRTVAIKLVATRDERADERLLREAKLLAKLAHPNVVAVHDVGTTDPEAGWGGRARIYIVMELVDGVTLRRWLSDRRRTRGEILAAFADAARGLDAAHRKGIVHRDFKPDNVIVGTDGRVRVVDFGLARNTASLEESVESTAASDGDDSVTRTGAIVGTPAYMAPEQHAGDVGDARADQYAFCIALWEALLGARPFRERTGQEEAPVPRGVPRWLAKLLRRGLSVDPRDRYASMTEVIQALDRGRRRPLLLASAAAAVVIAGVATSVVAWAGDPAVDCSDAAAKVESVWTPRRSATLGELFAAAPAAQQSGEVVIDRLDRWFEAWAEARTSVCDAVGRGGSATVEAGDASTTCLDRALNRVAGIVAVLERGDPAVVRHAVAGVEELPLLEGCALGRAPPTSARASDPRLPEIEADLVEIEATMQLGQFAGASERLGTLLDAAHELDDPGLIARILFARYVAELHPGHHDAAAQTLLSALAEAERAGDTGFAATIALNQVLVATHQHRVDVARVLLDQARARMKGAGLESSHGWIAARYEGMIEGRARNFARARMHLERARDLVVEARGARHPAVSNIEGSIAVTFEHEGKFAAALEHYQAAYEQSVEVFGTRHDETAVWLLNLGLTQLHLGQTEVALDSLERAHEVLEETLGAEATATLSALNGSAGALRNLGRTREAVERGEAHLAAARRRTDDPVLAVTAMLQLSRSLVLDERAEEALPYAVEARQRCPEIEACAGLMGKTYTHEALARLNLEQTEEAVALYRRALTEEERRFGPDHPDVAYVVGQLAECELLRGDRAEARSLFRDSLERHRRNGTRGSQVAYIEFELAKLERAHDREHAIVLAESALENYGPHAVDDGAAIEAFLLEARAR